MLAVEAKDSPGKNHQGQGRAVTTKVDSLAGPGNDFNSGDQPVGLSSDEGAVQAASEGGNLTDVIFVDEQVGGKGRVGAVGRALASHQCGPG